MVAVVKIVKESHYFSCGSMSRGLREERIDKMWLAVNDNGEYIWTLTKNNQCWPDGLIKVIN